MTQNRLTKSILLISLLLGSVVSCSPKNSSSSQKVESSNSDDSSGLVEFDTTNDVNILFYTTMGQTLQEVFNAYLEDFNQLYPNIHVSTQFIGGYDDVRDQMNTEIAAGQSEVNIAYCYPDHIATYNTSKSVVALDEYIDNEKYGFSDEQINDFVSAYFEEGYSLGDGKIYSLPFSKSSEVLYYNADVFTQHNLQVPTKWFGENDPASMEYACKTLKTLYPDSIPLGYDSEANWFITMCAQNNIPYTASTGENYLFDNSEAKEFVSKFKEWFDRGWVTTKNLYAAYTSGLFVEKSSQRSFMTIGSSAGATHQQPKDNEFEVGITQIPQSDETNKKVIQQGPNVCIFRNKDKQKELASWLFVKYFTTNVEFQAQFSMVSGYTPVIKSVFENDIYKEFLNEEGNIQALSTKVCVEQEANYFTSPAFDGSSEAREQVGNIIVQAFKGSKDINTIFADAVANCRG